MSTTSQAKPKAKWRKQVYSMTASSKVSVPACAFLALGVTCLFYRLDKYSDRGEPFAWCDGTSVWFTFASILFAMLLSVHFIVRANWSLAQNAVALTNDFSLEKSIHGERSIFGWEVSKLVPGLKPHAEKMIDINDLWPHYRYRGQILARLLRTAPSAIFYILAIWMLVLIMGDLPRTPTIGVFQYWAYEVLAWSAGITFIFLTFFVIDAIQLHNGFLKQLTARETYWPDTTFTKYSIPRDNANSDKCFADYWDILLIAKRTEAVGNIIYYPFVILSLFIVARLKYFNNWSWSPTIIIAFCLHFSLAFYAAVRLPNEARRYRDTVLARLKQRKLQGLIMRQKTSTAIDAMIEEVQSTRQGAFAYLWQQPAIRALLLPSGGIGLGTLLQFLPQ